MRVTFDVPKLTAGRRLAIILGTLLVLAVAAPAGAASENSVTGWGRMQSGGITASVMVSAHSDTNGDAATGVIRIDWPDVVTGLADVVCLATDGNQAEVGGRLRNPAPVPGEPGKFYEYVSVWVSDRGMPGAGQDGLNFGVVLPDSPVPQCLHVQDPPANLLVGNFTVVDG